jgi:hypothetical protein
MIIQQVLINILDRKLKILEKLLLIFINKLNLEIKLKISLKIITKIKIKYVNIIIKYNIKINFLNNISYIGKIR